MSSFHLPYYVVSDSSKLIDIHGVRLNAVFGFWYLLSFRIEFGTTDLQRILKSVPKVLCSLFAGIFCRKFTCEMKKLSGQRSKRVMAVKALFR
jgi:hypothetical protein